MVGIISMFGVVICVLMVVQEYNFRYMYVLQLIGMQKKKHKQLASRTTQQQLQCILAFSFGIRGLVVVNQICNTLLSKLATRI